MTDKERQIQSEFNKYKSSLIEWGDYVDKVLIEDLLSEMVDEYFIKIPPKCRLKTDKSYTSKVLYRKKNYTDPIIDVEDKVGTRIVVLKTTDIKVIQKRIMEYEGWISRITKHFDQEIEDKPRIFDYQSVHVVVCPVESHNVKRGLNRLALTCEIQIRTLLQHAFAEVSHDSTYKGPYKNDKEIIRKLARSMALMEATDDYFCKIFEMISDSDRHYFNYLNELIGLFQKFDSDFDQREVDIPLTDDILSLLDLKDVPISEVEEFVEKESADLKKLITEKRGYLFEQPVGILIYLYFKKHRTIFNEHWPLSNEARLSVYHAANTSPGQY